MFSSAHPAANLRKQRIEPTPASAVIAASPFDPWPASRNRCECSSCGASNTFPNADLGPPRHRLFASNTIVRNARTVMPDDSSKSPTTKTFPGGEAEATWAKTRPRFVPTTRSHQAMRPTASIAGATNVTTKCSMPPTFRARAFRADHF